MSNHSSFNQLDVEKTIVRKHDPFMVIEKPRSPVHIHTYGGETPFFKGLSEGKLLGSKCTNGKCDASKDDAFLPPRVYCPDCLEKMEWVDVANQSAKIYTHITVQYPGAFNKLTLPCHLISVKVEGTCTIMMSYLQKSEPQIGMAVRPVFNTKNPTYTILDLAWEPVT
jgi:uncharacterized protein